MLLSNANIDDITFRDLEIFLEFSRSEHLGETAATLGYSIPLIQRAVRALEDQVGVRLIERQGRRVRLLHAGRVMADQAAALLRNRVQAVEQVHLAAGRRGSRLAIGHNFSLGLDLVPTLVAEALERDPDLHVSLRSGTTNDLVAHVLSGDLDAAIVSPPPIEPDLESYALPGERNVFVVGANDPFAARETVPMAELRNRKFVALASEVGSRLSLLQTCGRAGFSPNIAIEVGDMAAIPAIVAANMAIALVPERLVVHTKDSIVIISVEPATSDRAIALVYLRKARDRHSIVTLRAAAEHFGTHSLRAAQ